LNVPKRSDCLGATIQSIWCNFTIFY
jgi:hypothetical protein